MKNYPSFIPVYPSLYETQIYITDNGSEKEILDQNIISAPHFL